MKTQRSLLSASIAAASLPVLALLAAPTFAQQGEADVAELERRIDELEQRLSSASGREAPEAGGDNNYVVSDGKGFTFGDITFNIGGFIKADMFYSSDGYGIVDNYSTGTPAIHHRQAFSDENDWRVGFSARESRLSLGTTSPVAGDQLTTYLEMDFNQMEGDGGNEYVSNSYSPRMRQAYGMWRGVTFGQTYTTFSDLAVLPELLNQGKHAGFIYATQPMLRYTMPVGSNSLMVALENPEDGLSGSYDDQSVADIVARYNMRGGWGMASVSAMARRLETAEDEAWGGAGAVNARIPLGRNDVRLQYAYGALGRYVGLASYRAMDAVEEATTGDAEVVNSQVMTAAYRHFWTETLRSNFVISHTEEVDDGAARFFRYANSGQVNLIWAPSERLHYGIEYAYWDFSHAGQTASETRPAIRRGDNENFQQVMLSGQFNF